MIPRFHHPLCAALLLLFWVADHPCFAVDDLSPEKFLQEYREAVKQYQTANSIIHIEGTMSQYRTDQSGSSESRDETHIAYSLVNGRERIILEEKDLENQKISVGSVTVLGCDRNFSLVRNSPKEAYRIQELVIPDSKAKRSQLASPYLTFSVDTPYTLAGLPVSLMIESSEFRFIKIERINKNGNTRVQVEFDYDRSRPGKTSRIRGWVNFDPKNKYSVCEYNFTDTVDGANYNYQGNSIYEFDENQVSLPQEVVCVETFFQSSKEIWKKEYRFQAERLSTDPIPDSEFTLAAYGLGDVEQPPGAPTNTLPYWAFGFAAVALGISVVLKRMARQA
ncbi:hypothetical protein [Isosphaera pallida]|nr:hypothetical protein [Isosphaera pallida]